MSGALSGHWSKATVVWVADVRGPARPVSAGEVRTVCVTANLTVMEHTIGVDKARARLGQLAEQAAASEPVILTRRGERLAVLIGPEDYEQLLAERRDRARERLADRLAAVRQSVTASGLDVSVVDEAIAAARALD
jgi:prevent-host-death family protein